MLNVKTFWLTVLALIFLVACSGGSLPPPIATLLPQAIPTAQPSVPAAAGTSAPSSPSPTSAPFPQGITNEPLAIVMTQPADKAEQVAVARDMARIIVQFNHPVVPLVAVEDQKDLPQPVQLQPSVAGEGKWINTSTFSFTPSQNLTVATQHTATIAPLKDMLGQSLSGYTWSFKTSSPAILKADPADKTQFVSATQPISVTFNTEMDRASTESRFGIRRQTDGTAATGRTEWQGAVMRFIPDKPLDYDTLYVAQLKAGAQDTNRVAGVAQDVSWTFRVVPRPAVLSTNPKNSQQGAKINEGFTIQFSSPMNRDSLKVTIQPTITNQSIYVEGGKAGEDGTTAHVHGGWLASQAYTITISGDSLTRYREKLGKDTVVRFVTAPREPELFLNVPDNMGMYDANVPQTIVATYVNVNQIDYKLYRVDRADYVGLIGRRYQDALQKFSPKEPNLLRTWSVKPQSPLNLTRLISTTLTADAGPLPAGVYFLQAGSPSRTRTSKHVLVVSGLNLALKRTETESLVWVTDLKSGQPVADQPLVVYDSVGKALASGKSDKDGIWRAKFARQNPWDPIYALSEVNGQIVAAVGSDWNSGIMTWDFNMPGEPETNEFYANIYTDRPIYRPGQSVYYKGILRRDNDAQYSLPTNVENVPITVRDAQGKQIFKQTVSLSKFGTFNGEIKLGETAAIGFYNLSMQVGEQPDEFYSSVPFQVAEYRRPEYQVEVKSDKTEYYQGDTIKVDVDTAYFFGGPVKDANVVWRLLNQDLFFEPENVEGYWDFADYDLAAERTHRGGVIREGKGKTDSAGKFHFEAPADLKDLPISQEFTLEAEVVDINNQSVSSRTVVPVHKGRYYIGLRPQRYVGTIGQEQAVDLLTVDTKGAPVANQTLTVSFFEHKWFSVREKRDDGNFYWRSSYTDTLASKVNVTSDAKGQATAKFTPSKGGVYKIVAEGQDASRNTVRSATYLWISSRDYVNWRMENNDRIDLVADKKEYAPGDTAEILIPAPFSNSEALLTIERGTIREVRRLTLAGNSERVRIPIKSDFAPNVFVSVLLVKGRGTDSPTPQFKLGYTNLNVSTVEKELQVKLTADCGRQNSAGVQSSIGAPPAAVCHPRDNANFTLQATDNLGKPVQAEFSVALVDKAIQSLADERAESPLDAFYGQRGLSVQTATTLVRSVERINQQLTPESKGGGGGLMEGQTVRRDFRDTAFWKADVVTDAAGRAQVSIPLPDNLTTWNLAAKGVTASTLVADARTDILSTQDLLVRPALPRFFVVGDKARLEAVVNNNTGKDVTTNVRIDAQGLTIGGNAQQAVTIKANDKAKAAWDVTVNPVEQVTVKFSATGGSLQDAIEQTLPVRRPISPQVVATAGQVETQTKEQIQLPSVVDKSAGELRVELSPSLAAASRDSLKYLESFEYECTEQTVSKFFPNVATYLALKKLGIEREDLRRELEANVSREVQRLYAFQRQDGGWGWWVDESKPTLTAYALLGLFQAREAGFAVDQEVMNRAEQFLQRYFDKSLDVKQPYTFNERAFVLYVLTEMGRNYTSRSVSLFDQRANLSHYGKAYLLLAMQKLKLQQAQTLQAELASAALTSATGAHWEESKNDYWTMNTNTRTTAVAILALSRSDPKNALLANAVRWLMVARKEGHWETTQETAWSVLALSEFMQSTGELQGNYTYQATFNGKALGDGTVNKSNVDQARTLTVAIKDMVQGAANELVVNKSAGDGRLYYSAFLNYYLPAENVPALNRGIIVARQYESVDPQTLQPTGKVIQSAKIGDYVRVTLTVIAPNDLHYLVLEDPLPAGFEAVDNTLKTSSTAAQSPQLREKPEAKPQDPWSRPYWYYWAHSEVRDDRVAAFATFLSRGTYEYSYMMRASVTGDFRTLPARAWEMYFPDVFGNSAGTLFTVGP